MTNSYSTQGTPSVAQLTDTQITNLQNNDLLQYDSTAQAWKNGTLDLAGTDLSLNNLDLSGTLTINGDSGYEGAVLTSEGTSNPTWRRPYFIKAMLEAEDDTGHADRNDYLLGDLVVQFSGTDFDYNNTNWNEATSTWTCPKTGIYRINAQVGFRLTDSGADRIRKTEIDIYNGATIVASSKMEIEGDSSTADDFKEFNSTVNALLKYDIGDTMQMKLSWEIWGSSETMRIIALFGKTFLQIERIS